MNTDFERRPLPERFCNLDRLLYSMESRGIDGVVASTPSNVFYLSGFNGIAHKSDEPRPYAVVFSRHVPDHPILILADYYVGNMLLQPTWIQDIRAFRAVMLGLDVPPREDDLYRFIPVEGQDLQWVQAAGRGYADNLTAACRAALKDLRLDTKCVAFDDLRLGHQLAIDGMAIADGYDPLMYARSVKTEFEIEKLRDATRLNERAIECTIGLWQRGMSWRELNRAYHAAAIGLGGFIRDPGAMVWGHPRGSDSAVTLQSGLEDFEVEPGMHVLFDCHGTLDLYCWDGGKTWVVDGEPNSDAKRIADATVAVAETVLEKMRPGVKVSHLQAAGRAIYRRKAVANPEAALIFFHGLGLSHMDLEQTTADGSSNEDWTLEEGMVVPLHILYPGDERHRIWVEEIALVTEGGGVPFFSWGFEPITG